MEIKLDLSKEYAIALEGGGAKGAYEIGVWQAFEEVGVKYCAVSGSSVGALNGALMAMRDLDKAVHLWENLTFSQIIDVDDVQMKAFFDKDGMQASGKVICPVLEGTRPFLIEVQALVSASFFQYPKRNATGYDNNS